MAGYEGRLPTVAAFGTPPGRGGCQRSPRRSRRALVQPTGLVSGARRRKEGAHANQGSSSPRCSPARPACSVTGRRVGSGTAAQEIGLSNRRRRPRVLGSGRRDHCDGRIPRSCGCRSNADHTAGHGAVRCHRAPSWRQWRDLASHSTFHAARSASQSASSRGTNSLSSNAGSTQMKPMSSPGENPPEPIPFHLGHMADQPVQGEPRGRHRPGLSLRVAEPLGLEFECRAMEIQPGLEHGPLTEKEIGLAPPWINQVIDHRCLLPLSPPHGERSANDVVPAHEGSEVDQCLECDPASPSSAECISMFQSSAPRVRSCRSAMRHPSGRRTTESW